SARVAHRSECRDRAAVTARARAIRAAAGLLRPDGASARGRGRRAISIRDGRLRHRAGRQECGVCAARHRECRLRSAAPRDRELRQALQILKAAWRRNISEGAEQVSAHATEAKDLEVRTRLACEYAKCKNRKDDFTIVISSLRLWL